MFEKVFIKPGISPSLIDGEYITDLGFLTWNGKHWASDNKNNNNIENPEWFLFELSYKFPNGYTSWHETHYEIVAEIERISNLDEPFGVVIERQEAQGHCGLYELAQELTDEFEMLFEGKEWDGEFFDEMEKFLKQKLYNENI